MRYIYNYEGEKIMLFATVGCSFTRGERLFYHRYAEDDELLDPKHIWDGGIH